MDKPWQCRLGFHQEGGVAWSPSLAQSYDISYKRYYRSEERAREEFLDDFEGSNRYKFTTWQTQCEKCGITIEGDIDSLSSAKAAVVLSRWFGRLPIEPMTKAQLREYELQTGLKDQKGRFYRPGI